MLWISHRGNIDGPNEKRENTAEYINEALALGLDVEIDVWFVDGELYLGHDHPFYNLPHEYLKNEHIWFHCKNARAIDYLQFMESLGHHKNIKYFWHQTDDCTLTSNQKVWTYPGKALIPNSIAVLPEQGHKGKLWRCFGICTDYITRYRKEYENRNIDEWTAT